MRRNESLLVWHKILMDWWDTGKVGEVVVHAKLREVFCLSDVPSTREDWDAWISRVLDSHVVAGSDESDAVKVLAQVERPISPSTIALNSTGAGLCGQHMHNVPYLVRLAIFHTWEHFSGNLTFPVPVVDPFEMVNGVLGTTVMVTDPQIAYFNNPGGSYAGSYGEKRLQLKQYAIDTITNAIAYVRDSKRMAFVPSYRRI